jgi:tripartite-type tricarboxylate transporter receptor subunit TctC
MRFVRQGDGGSFVKEMNVKAYIAALGAIIAAGIASAQAQSFPSRPVTIVVPYPAGGPADAIGRIVAEGMRAPLGQPVIIENVGGASGSVGVGRVGRAAPDGYTLIQGNWASNVLNAAIFSLNYDLLNDFAPVAWLGTEPLLIVAKKDFPPNNLTELIAWLKANPDKATQGTAGAGSVSHVAGVFFQKETGTRFQFVSYRGLGPAMQDLVAAQIDMVMPTAAIGVPQTRAGTVRAYAVTDRRRVAALPDIPTAGEAGLPGFEATNWQALWAPKATPKEVIARLNAAVVEALGDAAVRARLGNLGFAVTSRAEQTPEALGAHQKAEAEKWWPIIRAAGIKAER